MRTCVRVKADKAAKTFVYIKTICIGEIWQLSSNGVRDLALMMHN